jgi:TonB-dependent receptor
VGTDENTRALVQIDRLSYVERVVRAHQLRGEHQLGMRHRLDWSATTSEVNRSEPDRSEFVTWLDPDVPVWFNDFEGAVRTFGALEERSQEAGANYEFSFGANRGSPNRIRTGASYRTTERDARSQGFRIQAFDWSPTDPRWQASPEEFFDGRHAGPGDDVFLLSRELSGGSYGAEDALVAAYLMAEVNLLDRLRLVGGARVEQYDLTVDSENQLGQAQSTDLSYTDVLPALSAIVEVGENHQLRLAASRTLARPEYRELAPITYREVLGGEQVIGNSELERTLIQNFDVRWEWYPGPGEVLSLGLFAKRFDNPIEERYLARSGTDTRTFANAESATNEGIEAEVAMGLGRLSGRLEPLSLFSNLTVMRSRVVTGNEEDVERSMVGQAPYVFNTGVTWSQPQSGWSGTLLHNVVGERIVNARASGATVSDVVEQPRHVVDFSLRFPLLGSASGKLDFKNLLDAPVEVLQGSVVRSSYRTGRSVSVGVSWRW